MQRQKFAQKGYEDNPKCQYPPADPNDTTANIVARLDGFAQQKIAERKVDFEKKYKLKDAPFSDSSLTEMIRAEDERARLDPEIKRCLRDLRAELDRVQGKWVSMGGGSRGNSSFGRGHKYPQFISQAGESDSFGGRVEACYAEYYMIQPLPEGQTTKHPTISRWIKDGKAPSSEWQLLKASAAFLKWGGDRAIVWYLAGQQLCELKARATGAVRYVIEDIYQSLKSDRRFMRKREEDRLMFGAGGDEEEGEEEIWYDFEDDIPS